jgi:DNA-binding winged helix-turn-helix (wHTH) protein
MEAQGEVIQRAQLTAAVWQGTAISANALDQQVHAVRRALSELGSKVVVKAVYGEGFKLVFVLESLSHYLPG